MERTTTRAVHIGLAAVMILAVLAVGLAPMLMASSPAQAAAAVPTVPPYVGTTEGGKDAIAEGQDDGPRIRDEGEACYFASFSCIVVAVVSGGTAGGVCGAAVAGACYISQNPEQVQSPRPLAVAPVAPLPPSCWPPPSSLSSIVLYLTSWLATLGQVCPQRNMAPITIHVSLRNQAPATGTTNGSFGK